MKSINIKNIEDRLKISNIHKSDLFPKYFEIETINACNARCIMCTVNEWNANKANENTMSMDLFRKIVGELKNYSQWIETVCLNRDGEPTLDNFLVERVKMLKGIGIKKVTFSTNAQLLNKNLAKKLLEAGLDDIMISIDGFSKETFEKIRRKLNYEKVLHNILNFIKLRNELKSNCSIRIRAIKMEENKDELDEWLIYWKKQLLKQDKAYIMPMHSWGNQLYKETYEKIKYFSNKACISVFSTMIIHVNGKVPLCGCDYDKKYNMGDVKLNTIKEIWDSEKFKLVRKYHLNSNRNEIELCQGCDIWDRSYES